MLKSALTAAIVAFACSGAYAQTCGDKAKFEAIAEQTYGEVLYAEMTSSHGVPVYLYLDPVDHSYTLFVAPSPDMYCVLDTGDDFTLTGDPA